MRAEAPACAAQPIAAARKAAQARRDAVECNGGTARSLIEEIYRLPPGGAPTLVRDNSVRLH